MKFMKKIVLGVFAFVFIFITIATIQLKLNVNATSELSTSDDISVKGAGVRLTTKSGIRFVGNVSNSFDKTNVKAYGMIIAYGNKTVDDTFIKGGTYADKDILFAEDTQLDSEGNFYVVLFNVPEDGYTQNVTARAYVVLNDDSIIYASTATTRNLVEVSQKALSNGYTGEFLTTVTNYVNNNYFSTMYLTIDSKQYLLCTSTKYSFDILTLKSEFLKDWNTKFESSLDGSSFCATTGDTTPFGLVAEGSSANDISGNLYTFFNDATYKAKWDWLLEYVMEKLYTSTDDTYKQADAILNGINLTGNLSWNYGRNLIATLSGLFTTSTQTHYVAGYDFTNNGEVLFELANYNDQVLANLSNVTFAKKNAVTLIDKATSGYTCTYTAYPADSTTYITGSTIDLSAVTYKAFSVTLTAAPVYVVYADSLDSFVEGIDIVSEGGKVIVTAPITLTEDVTVNKAITIEGRTNITGISYVKPGTGFSRNSDIDNNYPSKLYIFKQVPSSDFLALLNNSDDKVVLDKNIELSNNGDLNITKESGVIDLNGYILNLNGKALKIGVGSCWNICDSAYHFDSTSDQTAHRQTMGAIWSTNELTDLGGTLNIWGGLYHMNCYCFTYITDSTAHINFMNGYLDGCFYTLRVNGNGSTVKFAGGQFKDFDPSDKNIENTYANQGITPRAMGTSTGSYVAMIEPNGEMHGYDTLTEAIAAIGQKSLTGKVTIMLKSSLLETITIPATANVEINLNGNVLDGSITVENGGILVVNNYIQSGSLTATVNGTYTNLLD